MPIYEYQCNACGHAFEKLQKISDAPLTDCPKCNKPELQKLISAAGFRLKGAGWYETDFKQGGSKKNLVGDSSKSSSNATTDSSAKPAPAKTGDSSSS